MPELDDLFRGASELSAQDVFTNRVGEVDAFFDSLAAWRAERPCHPFPPNDPERVNVLAYYGIGGIGKSTLSRQLQKLFLARDYPGASKKVLAIRIDFDDPALLDLETLVITIRGCLGSLSSSWEAFDVAFASYWVRAHPGLPLQEFVAETALFGRTQNVVEMGNQVIMTLKTFLGEEPLALLKDVPAAGAILNLAGRLQDGIRKQIVRHRLAKQLPSLPKMLEAEAPELLKFLPALLSADVDRLCTKQWADVVVFLDTYEQVQNAPRRRDGPEDNIVRLAYFMPNVLFVVTGRNRLTWGDGDVAIRYSGPRCWPLLARAQNEEEPRQHLVGMLSEADARSYLSQRLVLGGKPAMSEEIIEAIVAGSPQPPLYLDLSAEHYEELVAQRRSPQPSDFGGTFAELVLSLMRDLSERHRNMLRAAALARWFTPQLLASGVEAASVGDATRFYQRAVVLRDPVRHFAGSLHANLAAAVNEHQSALDDGWVDDDTEQAAKRMLTCLREDLQVAFDEPETDRRLLVEATPIAFRLAHFARLAPDWLFELAYALRSIWARDVLMTARGDADSDDLLSDVGLVYEGMGLKLLEENQDAMDRFRQVLERGRLSQTGQLFVRHRLGKSLEYEGRLQEAQAEFDQAVGGGLLEMIARKDAARVRLLRGDPHAAVEWANEYADHPSAVVRDLARDLLGLALWMAGDFAGAAEQYRILLDDPELVKAGLARQTASRHRALALCWIETKTAMDAAREAYEINETMGLKVGMAQARVAEAVAGAGTELAPGEAEAKLDEAAQLFVDAGDRAELFFAELGRLWTACISGNRARSAEVAASLRDEIRRYGVHPCLGEVAQAWLAERHGEPYPAPGPAVWLDRDAGLASWAGALRARVALAQR